MNTLKEDLKEDLNNVQRWWIRKPSVIMLTLIVIPVGALLGIIDIVKQLYDDCW